MRDVSLFFLGKVYEKARTKDTVQYMLKHVKTVLKQFYT